MTLTTLTDDGLLHVLRYLQPRELLQCRGVCRRLRDLALHPHLWRHRRLTWQSDCVQLLAATLRLAPCASTLNLPLRQETCLQVAPLLASTNCAISELVFELEDTAVVFAVMAYARQAALGRLRTVSLKLSSGKKESALRMLLDQILYTQGLTSLKLHEREHLSTRDVPPGPCLPKAAKGHAISASLRRLQYGLQDGNLPFYLQWHADTLQEVLLGGKVKPPAGTAALLGALPLLRQLECPPLDGMPALLQCPALETLYLHVNVDASTRPFLPGVLEYLRQAVTDRLKTLTLQFTSKPREPLAVVGEVNLVQSLAGPGRGAVSSLRSLRLDFDGDGNYAGQPQPHLLPLASVLHRLVNLVFLDIGGPPTTAFLEVMDGKVLPRLERLNISLVNEGGEGWGCGCPHEWAHGDRARALLRVYPRLHIVVESEHSAGCFACDYRGCDVCKCGFCDLNGCHDFDSYGYHVLFSHPDHELCDENPDEIMEMEVLVDL